MPTPKPTPKAILSELLRPPDDELEAPPPLIVSFVPPFMLSVPQLLWLPQLFVCLFARRKLRAPSGSSVLRSIRHSLLYPVYLRLPNLDLWLRAVRAPASSREVKYGKPKTVPLTARAIKRRMILNAFILESLK